MAGAPAALSPVLHTLAQSSRAWFVPITNQASRRASFDSVTDLKPKISDFVEPYNQNARLFMWTATAESILAKLERLCKVINGTLP